MPFCGVATDTVEVLAIGPHVDIERLVGFYQRSIQIPMLDTITASSVKMT